MNRNRRPKTVEKVKKNKKYDIYDLLRVVVILPCLALLISLVLICVTGIDIKTADRSIVEEIANDGLSTSVEYDYDFVIDDAGCYIIYSYTGLKSFASAVKDGNTTLCGKLAADVAIDEISEWEPLGTPVDGVPIYSGTFSGNGHTISGLHIDSESFAGFTGILDGGTIESLALYNCEVTGKEYVGGIAGENKGSITDCVFHGNVTGNADSIFVGGIAGGNEGDISACSNYGHVSGSAYIGGIAGISSNAISNCSTFGQQTGETAVGGIVGINEDGTVEKSTMSETATIEAVDCIGGIVGINNNKGCVEECTNETSEAKSISTFGLIAGINYGRIAHCIYQSQGSRPIGADYGRIIK